MLKAALTRGAAWLTAGSWTKGSAGDRDVEGGPTGAAALESPVAVVPVAGASGKRRRRTGSSAWAAMARATAGVLTKAPGRGRTGVAWVKAMVKGIPGAEGKGSRRDRLCWTQMFLEGLESARCQTGSGVIGARRFWFVASRPVGGTKKRSVAAR